MFVLTAKLSKPKLIAAGVLLIAAILLIVLLALSGGSGSSGARLPAGSTNDERVAYLATFGWSVNAEPAETQKVKIPDTADNKVFARYNDLQKSQGFDLTDFAGKEATRYVYEVLNYPEAASPVLASVLVYEGRIIGGDVTNTAPDGLIHGFAKPGTTAPTDEETAPSSEMTEPGSSQPSQEPTETAEPTEPVEATS